LQAPRNRVPFASRPTPIVTALTDHPLLAFLSRKRQIVWMRVPLQTTRARLILAIPVTFISIGLSILAGKVWIAHHWSESSNPADWLRAAKLEPGDAAYWQRLSLYAALDTTPGNPNHGIGDLKRAALIDPDSAELWADLADAYEQDGKPSKAQEAFEKAQADYPVSGEIAWRYGSFLLRQGNLAEGFTQIRRALAVDPSLSTSALAECWEASGDVDSVVAKALPRASSYYFTALSYFLSQKRDDAALIVWKSLLKLNQPIRMSETIPLVNQLISDHHVSQAQTAWQEALQVAHWPQAENDNGSLVFNGGFEHEVANGGFGWREEPVSGVTYGFDDLVAHSGKQSLRVTFDGSANFDFAQLLQFVPVKPNEHYRFTAYLHTEGITTDSGVRFLIYDPSDPSQPQTLTPNTVGTNPWNQAQSDFSTGPQADLLVIALRRIPSWKFDNKLAGTVWLDDVSLVPTGTPGTGKPK
jgi:tetratricopeptide (TPR) repeat protein